MATATLDRPDRPTTVPPPIAHPTPEGQRPETVPVTPPPPSETTHEREADVIRRRRVEAATPGQESHEREPTSQEELRRRWNDADPPPTYRPR